MKLIILNMIDPSDWVGETPTDQLHSADTFLDFSNYMVASIGDQHEAFLLRVLRRIREGKFSNKNIKLFDEDGEIEITEDGDLSRNLPMMEWRAKELFNNGGVI